MPCGIYLFVYLALFTYNIHIPGSMSYNQGACLYKLSYKAIENKKKGK